MEERIERIEGTLKAELAVPEAPYSRVFEAMAYSVEAGGKRLRPYLLLTFCALCGGSEADAMPLACAIEMIHSYSLIHDDLPCMDNDDMRRGKPSCHKQFGESTALLAGDGLLTKAFETAAKASVRPGDLARCIGLLAAYAGPAGMVGGQVLDLENEILPPDGERLALTYQLKTCNLIRAACEIGAIAGGGSEEQVKAAGRYAHALGMAFQIVDDILDATGDEAVLGKPIGSDAENGKTTYLTLYGLDGAKEWAARWSDEALEALKAFPGSEELAQVTQGLLKRTY